MAQRGVEPKPRWRHVPESVRDAVTDMLSAPVARGMRVWGGYGPTPTFRLRLTDGRRAFLKGSSPASSDRMRASFARELLVYMELRDYIDGWAPKVYGHFSLDGWDILVLEDLGPKSVPPWRPHRTGSIMRAFGVFHVAGRDLVLPTWLQPPSAWLNDASHLWAWTRDRGAIVQSAAVAGTRATEAARWFEATGSVLASEARGLLRAGATHQLLHCDARSDNLRWKDGCLYLFDWAQVVAGPPELDVAFFAQSITVESGLAPEQSVSWYEEVNPLDPRLLDAAVCTAAGFFADQAWREELPGLPRLRAFQRQQMAVTLKWTLRRLKLEPPEWLNAMHDEVLAPQANTITTSGLQTSQTENHSG